MLAGKSLSAGGGGEEMGAEEEVEKEGEEEDVWKKMKIVRDKPLKSNGSSALAIYI